MINAIRLGKKYQKQNKKYIEKITREIVEEKIWQKMKGIYSTKANMKRALHDLEKKGLIKWQ